MTEVRKSTSVTNLDAPASLGVQPGRSGAALRVLYDEVQINSTDGPTNELYRISRVHSSWLYVASCLIHPSFMASSGVIDVGVRQTAANGLAVVKTNAFICDQDVTTTGGATLLPRAFSGTDGQLRRIWECAEVSSDPGIYWDVVMQCGAASIDTTTKVAFLLLYVDAPI